MHFVSPVLGRLRDDLSSRRRYSANEVSEILTLGVLLVTDNGNKNMIERCHIVANVVDGNFDGGWTWNFTIVLHTTTWCLTCSSRRLNTAAGGRSHHYCHRSRYLDAAKLDRLTVNLDLLTSTW